MQLVGVGFCNAHVIVCHLQVQRYERLRHQYLHKVLRERLQPTKINLAALGNKVPHLHWHVIARFEWDSHFPEAVWGECQRAVEPPAEARLACSLAALDAAVGRGLGRA